jgi:hypothetical protein
MKKNLNPSPVYATKYIDINTIDYDTWCEKGRKTALSRDLQAEWRVVLVTGPNK